MINNILNTISLSALIFMGTSASTISAAPPLPVPDDNRNSSFVRQIVPKLLGRKPKGTVEVNLLKDIADLHGRESVVRLLMEQDEFVSHWTAILIDHLKVQRAVNLQKNRAQTPECFEKIETEGVAGNGASGLMSNSPQTSDLAEFVRDSNSATPFVKDFNMHDLIKSSLHLDNLFPAYRGYLYTLASHPNGTGMRTVEEARAEIGEAFDDIFLNRNMQCISCHRGTYSTTGIGDRTHPLYKSLDNAVFDFSGLSELPDIENNAYITQCADCHGAKGTGNPAIDAPGIIGFTKEMFEQAVADAIPNGGLMASVIVAPADDTLASTTDSINTGIETIVNALRDQSVFALTDLGDTAGRHFAAFRRDFFAYEDPDVGEGPWGMNTSCASILDNVSEAIPTFFAGVDSDTATVKDIDEQLHHGYQDLPVAVTWMSNLDPSNLIPGRTAVAYMLAAKITDNVWEQIFGERLTIVNQFARNAWQKEMHQYLTEEVFIANDWSLKELIVEILGTRFFNRRAPDISGAAGPYRLHPLFDPFVLSNQTCLYQEEHGSSRSSARGMFAIEHIPNENCAFNGQGELVHRYAPRTLLNSISSALSWPEPKIFPGDNYPSEEFSASIGQYTSEYDVGDKTVGFQGLLNWDNQYGTCADPGGSSEDGDWINRLIENIDEFNALNLDSPLSLRELVLALKDWLIQEPFFDEPEIAGLQVLEPEFIWIPNNPELAKKTLSEEQLVGALLGTNLDENVTSTSVDEDKLRELCGVYLKAPQFMLAGIVRSNTFNPPRYRVCNDDNCSYQSMCDTYSPDLNKLGYPVACGFNPIINPVKTLPLKLYTTGKDDDGGKNASALCVKC